MRILVISDTHIPRVAHDLPAAIYDEIKKVDMILHAGDFVERSVYEKLKSLKDLRAVAGNMDSQFLKDNLKAKEVIEVGKFKIGLVHGHGAKRDLINTVRNEFGKVDAIVFGHSHDAISIVKDGILFLNPGSPTDNIFAAYNSYGIIELDDKKIEGKIIKL